MGAAPRAVTVRPAFGLVVAFEPAELNENNGNDAAGAAGAAGHPAPDPKLTGERALTILRA